MNRLSLALLSSLVLIAGAACTAPVAEEATASTTASIEESVAVHRLVNPYAGNVMLTSDKDLIERARAAYGSVDEGIAFGAATGAVGTKYLYRSVNATTYDMFYSTDAGLIRALSGYGYDEPEIALLVYEHGGVGRVALHRASHYFEGKLMHDYFTDSVPEGWTDHGAIAYVVDPVSVGGKPSGLPRPSSFTVSVDGVEMTPRRVVVGHDVIEGRTRNNFDLYFTGPGLNDDTRIALFTEKTFLGCSGMFSNLQYQPGDGTYRTFDANPYEGPCGLVVYYTGNGRVRGVFSNRVRFQNQNDEQHLAISFDLAL
jgi:hypothetical protein